MIRTFIKRNLLVIADLVASSLVKLNRQSDINMVVGSIESVYILMLKPLGVGDVMMLSPFVQLLEDSNKFQQVYLVTEYTPFINFRNIEWLHPALLTNNNLSSSLVLSPTLSWRHLRSMFFSRYYLGYFLSNRLISNFVSVDYSYQPKTQHYFKRACALLDVLDIPVDKAHSLFYSDIITSVIDGQKIENDYICIAPFSNWPERQYPFVNIMEIIKTLRVKWKVILVGGNGDLELAFSDLLIAELGDYNILKITGRTSLSQVGGVIAGATAFIGNDSGLAHMAFLTGIPSVVIFGCVPGELRIPLRGVSSKKISALGAGKNCALFPCYDGYNKPTCRNKDKYVCLGSVNPDTVLQALYQLLEN